MLLRIVAILLLFYISPRIAAVRFNRWAETAESRANDIRGGGGDADYDDDTLLAVASTPSQSQSTIDGEDFLHSLLVPSTSNAANDSVVDSDVNGGEGGDDRIIMEASGEEEGEEGLRPPLVAVVNTSSVTASATTDTTTMTPLTAATMTTRESESNMKTINFHSIKCKGIFKNSQHQ